MSTPRGLLVLAACASPGLAGCWVDDPLPASPPPLPVLPSISAGSYAVQVDAAAIDVALVRGPSVLLDLPADAFALGVLPSLDDATNYDPYTLVVPSVLHPP